MLTIVSSKLLYKFSNTQINAPKGLADKIITWCDKHINEEDVYTEEDDPTLGREDEPHVTVKYGLHTSDPEDVRKIVKGFGEFDVTLGKISKFESEKYDVLKAEVTSKKLQQLNKLLSESLEVTDKFPNYVPHLTLSYIKKGSCTELLGETYFKGITWTVNEIKFCSRKGEKTTLSL